MLKLMIKYGLILLIICFIASGLLSGVFMFTSPKINAQKAREQKEAFANVMPLAQAFKEVKQDSEVLYYIGYKDKSEKEIAGYVFLTTAKGYSSAIEIMAGIDDSGKITGIKILTQAETPGLGARIDEVLSDKTLFGPKQKTKQAQPQEAWFQKQFKGKPVQDLVVAKEKTDKNIQAITGATITSEAVTKAVKEKAQEIFDLVKGKK